ncbi:hypothetical protein HY224_03295 [Candidatus Uhrbacteria bacterium]|nr:hypothetical protein [Candidatus Uhrbacteria bacterium]
MKKILLALSLIFLMGQSCVIAKSSGADGGVFKSENFGETWAQKIFIGQQKGKNLTIGGVNVLKIAIDPSNAKTIYIATRENGVFVTYDAGEHWLLALPVTDPVRTLAIDPRNRQVIYVAVNQKIYKTVDGGQNWALMFSEPRNELIQDIQVDQYDTRRIYAGINDGQLLKSSDAGQSWTPIGNFASRIKKILIDPRDSRIIYVGTATKSIFKTYTGGLAWEGLSKQFELFDTSANNVQDLILNRSQPDKLIVATNYGLLKSDDGGTTWTPFKLLTPPNTVTIRSITQNYAKPNEIIYGTDQNLFKTVDGGKTWISKPLPTGRSAGSLLIDPTNPQIVYLGALNIK